MAEAAADCELILSAEPVLEPLARVVTLAADNATFGVTEPLTDIAA